MAITSTQIYTLAAQLAQDEGFNTNSATDYLAATNEAHRRLAEILKTEVKTDSTIDTIGGTQYYSLPSDYMGMYDTYSGSFGPVAYTDAAGRINYPVFTTYQNVRNAAATGLKTDTGTPVYCWTDVQNRLWFYPTPDYSATNNVTVEYYNYPTSLADLATSDYPDKYLYVLAYLTAEVIAAINELDSDILKFNRLAMTRLNAISGAGDNLDTNKNLKRIGYLG